MKDPDTIIKLTELDVPSPCFVLDRKRLESNLYYLNKIMGNSEVGIICALKGFAMYHVFPLVHQYLSGGSASSLNEAKLLHEHSIGKIHTYCPAYFLKEMEEVLQLSDHISFNSLSEWNRYKKQVFSHNVSPGLRVNPQYSEIETKLYDPADPQSRLGISRFELGDELPEGIEGLHFHVLCENDSHTLERVLLQFEQSFGDLIHQCKWVNFGGGHLITHKDYDVEHLSMLLAKFKDKYEVEIILEPGSAIAWETGYLISTVLDIVKRGEKQTAILDISFTCHLPDCLEMPYKPAVLGEKENGPHQYSLGGVSCLAGDYIDGFLFAEPLNIGDQIIFDDMMHYTMVKTSTFNGINLPSIAIWHENGEFELIKKFGFEEYKSRL